MPTAGSRPLVIAHRGASAEAPEHTIAAFELALGQGADGVQLDVHLSADGQPVVIHDFTLERTTDGAGPVVEHTVRQLKRLDAGGWHERRFRGQRIQTLQEVLERFRDRVRFWIDLKGGSGLYPALEERVVSTVEIYDAVDRVVIQSFDHEALGRVRALNPAIAVGARLARRPAELPGLEVAGAICPDPGVLSEDLLAEARRAGQVCYAWTTNEAARLDRLVEWGVEGIITDQPGPLWVRLGR